MTTTVLETLVGEGKKFSDAEALAIGKVKADEHIANLNAQLETLKAQAAAGTSVSAEALDKILAEIKQSREPVTNPGTSSNNGNQSVKVPTEAEIMAMIDRRHQEAARAQVRAETLSKVEKAYGSKTDEFLSKMSSETGFTVDQLKALAGTNPNAFLKLANIGQTVSHESAKPGTVNSQAMTSNVNNDGSVRNKAFYDAKMKEMGAKKFAFDTGLQQQMHRDMLSPNWDN